MKMLALALAAVSSVAPAPKVERTETGVIVTPVNGPAV